jgi:hypothetical protein
MAIEIIGGSELATPTQARVMMFGFAPSSWQVTKTTGVTKSALVGFKLFLGIFSSSASFLFSNGHLILSSRPVSSIGEQRGRIAYGASFRLNRIY